jgi:hypothetical protein
MTLATDSINKDGTFDPRYTCDLDNSSPELHWDQFPETTAGFALIVEDRDSPSGNFTHWLIYNIPLNINHLPAGIPPQEALPNGILQGINSFGKLGYTGPCPPYGDPAHHYAFRVFALKNLIPLSHRTNRETLMAKMGPYIVATGETMGTYRRAIQKAG